MTPALYTVAGGQNFAEGFARGYWQRHGGTPPETRAGTLVLLNTTRTQAAVEGMLADLAPMPGPIPRTGLVEALGADPFGPLPFGADPFGPLLPCDGAEPGGRIPPAIAPLRRRLRLLALVEYFDLPVSRS